MSFPLHRRFKNFGRGVRRKPGEMNKTEAEYAEVLESQIRDGCTEAYWFESTTLKLAKDTRYTPDFMVMMSDGRIEFHEVKGHWEDDAKVKIKVAAAMFPFRFIAVKKRAKKDGGGFEITEF
jgi:ribosomal protein L39E